MEFYDRSDELKDIKSKYDELSSGELCLIYGRRRLGKTVFIKRFMNQIKGKAVYYFVNKTNKKELLDLLSASIFDQTGESEKFTEWEHFFEYLQKKATTEKFVFIMDEFSRLKEHSPDFLTKFQDSWDSKLSKTKIMFIAIGSSMSMMYDIFMDRTAPLYGRMTWKMLFKPFRYVDFRKMFSEIKEEKKIEIFSIFGGTPHFLWFAKKYASEPLIGIIDKLVLSRTGPLRDEPNNFITMELKKETNYNSILHAMAKTNGSREEILTQTGIDQKDIDYYFNNLSDLLCIMKKITPLFHDKGPKTRYKFDDNLFHFWYRFIFPNWSLIELGNTELLRKKISMDVNSFIGLRFEEIVMELLILYNNKKLKNLQLDFNEIGQWWGKNREGNPEEIDILANNSQSRKLIVCEVKWTDKKTTINCVKDLIEKSRLINANGSMDYIVVSKSGFKEECFNYMDEKGITHLDLDEIADLFERIA